MNKVYFKVFLSEILTKIKNMNLKKIILITQLILSILLSPVLLPFSHAREHRQSYDRQQMLSPSICIENDFFKNLFLDKNNSNLLKTLNHGIQEEDWRYNYSEGQLLAIRGQQIIPEKLALTTAPFLFSRYLKNNRGLIRWQVQLCLLHGDGIYRDVWPYWYLNEFRIWNAQHQNKLSDWEFRVNLTARFMPASALIALLTQRKIITTYVPLKSWDSCQMYHNVLDRVLKEIELTTPSLQQLRADNKTAFLYIEKSI